MCIRHDFNAQVVSSQLCFHHQLIQGLGSARGERIGAILSISQACAHPFEFPGVCQSFKSPHPNPLLPMDISLPKSFIFPRLLFVPTGMAASGNCDVKQFWLIVYLFVCFVPYPPPLFLTNILGNRSFPSEKTVSQCQITTTPYKGGFTRELEDIVKY